MPEITQEDLDALNAKADGVSDTAAPPPPPDQVEAVTEDVREHAAAAPAAETVSISRADLEALVARAARGDAAEPDGPAPEPVEPTHVALLANGERYEYAGGHPTHVADGDNLVAVTAVYPLPVLSDADKKRQMNDQYGKDQPVT